LEDRRRAELRDLPSVDAVLRTDLAAALTERFGHEATANAVRALLTEIRATWNSAESTPPTKEQLAHEAQIYLDREDRSRMQPVFNLTGTIIHTNLGRALLAEPAIEAAIQAMHETVALEFDVPAGRRGERDDHVRDLLCELTGAQPEPTVREAVAHGADVVTFSGDKLLGGPQAGFIVGKRSVIEAINRNPMKRALRVDKMRLAAIEVTLKLYRNPERLAQSLPTLQLLARTQSGIAAQARRILPAVHAAVGSGFTDICQCQSQVGSGAMPLDTVPSAGLCIRSKGRDSELDSLAAKLRALEKPILGRIEDHSLILDLRCLTNESELLVMLSSLKHENAVSTTSAPSSPTGKAP
jgi:seryl-tRNA(Sec) selenium transferase